MGSLGRQGERSGPKKSDSEAVGGCLVAQMIQMHVPPVFHLPDGDLHAVYIQPSYLFELQ